MKVSIDFDDTLTRPDVQEYAKELIIRGIEVWIVTTRWDRTSRFCDKQYFKWHGNRSWQEVHVMAKELGIPIRQCRFTNYTWKSAYFKDNQDFVWHLDDNPEESDKMRHGKVKFVWVERSNWREKCDQLLADYNNIP